MTTLAPVGALVLVLGTAAVVLAGLLLAACLRLRSAVSFLLATYLFASAEIVLAALLLSTGRWLDRGALLVSAGALLAVALAAWIRLGRPPAPIGPRTAVREALSDRVVAALAALTGLVHTYLLAVALTVPQGVGDVLLYHLPRAALWKQQHAVAYVAHAPDERIDTFPPNAELEAMASMIWSGGDRYVSLVQLLALAVACIAIFGIARRLGLHPRQAAFGALVYATLTVVVLQTPTALNDLVVASLLTVCAYFALGASRRELTLAALALALALGTKLTATFALPALALFVFAGQPRRRWLPLALLGGAGAVVGSYWLAVNLAQTGRLDGGVALDRGEDSIPDRIGRHLRDLLELSDEEGRGFLAGPVWSVGALGIACVAAALLLARGRRRGAVVALLGGALGGIAAPMLVTWARLTRLVVERALGAAGLESATSRPRVPEGLYESPMHSSFGIVFALLLLVAAVLVVAEVAKGRLPRAAAAALLGVPLTLVVLSLALAYDPQHMRYLAFPAALATAVFGIVLRLRLVGWASVVLTAATIVVTLGYFSPRPAGLALRSANRAADRTARWLVQAEAGRGDREAFRYLALEIPGDATLALSVVRDTYLYPAWDAGLRRTVLFVPEDGPIPAEAEWLVIGPGSDFDPPAGWRERLATGQGWRILGR